MASNDSVDDQELLDELDDLVKISDEKERKSAEIGRKFDEKDQSLDEEDQDLLDRLNRLDVVGASLAGDSKRPRIEGKIPEQMALPLT